MRHVSKAELIAALHEHPGLVPLRIHHQTLEWIDFERYHIYEGFFHKAVDRFSGLKQSVTNGSVFRLLSDLTVLADPEILVQPGEPTGFIFHCGRSGSTLLTKVLARDRAHLVIGEAAPHNQVLLALTNNGCTTLQATIEQQTIYRNLLLLMGRWRSPDYQAYIIKFTSFNILFFDFIRSVFPEVPAIFLYREPAQILASFERSPPSWFDRREDGLHRLLTIRTKGEFGSDSLVLTELLADFFQAGAAIADKIRLLDYQELTAQNLPEILKALNFECSPAQLALMQTQFAYDAKEENRYQPFNLNRAAQNPLPPDHRLTKLYQQMRQSPRNIKS